MTDLQVQGSQNGYQDPDPVDPSLDELIDDLMKQQVSRQWASPAPLPAPNLRLSHTTPPSPHLLVPFSHTECCTSQVSLRLSGIPTV